MPTEPVVGVLALQGDVREHLAMLDRLRCAPRSRYADLPSWPTSTRW